MFKLLIGRGGVARHPIGDAIPSGFSEAPLSADVRTALWRRTGGELEKVGLKGVALTDVEAILVSKSRRATVRGRRPSAERVRLARTRLAGQGLLPRNRRPRRGR
jgi:hypothetical protein